jgi:hypothetical protein
MMMSSVKFVVARRRFWWLAFFNHNFCSFWLLTSLKIHVCKCTDLNTDIRISVHSFKVRKTLSSLDAPISNHVFPAWYTDSWPHLLPCAELHFKWATSYHMLSLTLQCGPYVLYHNNWSADPFVFASDSLCEPSSKIGTPRSSRIFLLLLYHGTPVAMRGPLECRTCRIIYTNVFGISGTSGIQSILEWNKDILFYIMTLANNLLLPFDNKLEIRCFSFYYFRCAENKESQAKYHNT